MHRFLKMNSVIGDRALKTGMSAMSDVTQRFSVLATGPDLTCRPVMFCFSCTHMHVLMLC